MVRLRVIHPEDALGTVIHEDQVDLLGDLLISLLPGNGLKPVPHSFQGAFEPVGAVKIIDVAVAAGADQA